MPQSTRFPSFFEAEYYSIQYICHIFFIHSSTDQHKLFPYLRHCEQCCKECGGANIFELVFSFSSYKYPKVGLLYHMVVVFLIFVGTSTLFSVVAASIISHQYCIQVPSSSSSSSSPPSSSKWLPVIKTRLHPD